jgi:chromosome segregation ATPase
MLISKLKAHIFELEQGEKDYDNLNHKFRNLQNDCALLNEEKLRLEYELKQRGDSHSKYILDLRSENENLQLTYNEKLALNKKLFNENNNLIKLNEERNIEIQDLKDRLNDAYSQLSKLEDDKNGLERAMHNLNDIKTSQKIEISKLIEDNQKLSRICQDQDKQNKNLESEKHKLLAKNEETNFELKNLVGKLKSREENLTYSQRQLDETKNSNVKLQQTLKDYEKQFDHLRNEIANSNGALQKERSLRIEAEKSNEQLQNLINERDREIGRYVNELNSSRAINQRFNEEKNELGSENDRLKNHIMMLTEQNHKVKIYLKKKFS